MAWWILGEPSVREALMIAWIVGFVGGVWTTAFRYRQASRRLQQETAGRLDRVNTLLQANVADSAENESRLAMIRLTLGLHETKH
jgi:hypothetical protein